MRPQKEDWTKVCDATAPHLGADDPCFSIQESSWGTDTLRKLEKIHSEVDPHGLFHCPGCVGYVDESDIHVVPTSSKSKKIKKC